MSSKFRLLKADEIECRVQACKEKGVSLLLYKDARCDMNILDETVGSECWQRYHKELKGNIYCGVGIFNKDIDEWVTKWDAGAESYTEKEKGEASDSFKRACVNWGIGRELYTAPFIWIGASSCRALKQNNKGTWQCFDRFSVRDIGYYDGAIDYLVIEDDRHIIVYTHGDADPRQRMRSHYKDYCMRNGLDEKEVAERFNLTKESTTEDFAKALEVLKDERR